MGLFENVMVVPLTVMVSPAAKPLDSESDPAMPERVVAAVIGVGGVVQEINARTIGIGLRFNEGVG